MHSHKLVYANMCRTPLPRLFPAKFLHSKFESASLYPKITRHVTMSTPSTDNGKRIVRKAVKMLNPLKVLSEENIPWTITLSTGASLSLTQSYATHLSEKTSEWAYRLWEKNMRESYVKSDWGFDEKEKRGELLATTSRYLIYWATIEGEEEKKPIAYLHYRFDMDFGVPVCYCYELQVEMAYQRQGIARHLVNLLCALAKATKMTKVVSTVFKNNDASNAFFLSCGFVLDKSDPSNFVKEGGDKVDYNIYGKPV